MTLKLRCDPSKLPAPKLPKPRLQVQDKEKRPKKNFERRKIRYGINKGKYGAPVFWTPEKNAIIAKMHSEGKTYEEIADEFGKTKESVRRQWYNIRDGRAQTK